MLNRVAAALPQLRPGAAPSTVPIGGTQYRTLIPLRSPADDVATRATFLRWVWYAVSAGTVCISTMPTMISTRPSGSRTSLKIIAPTLRLTQAEQQELLPHARLARYGADEDLQRSGPGAQGG